MLGAAGLTRAGTEEMESQLRAVESFLFFFLIDKLGQKEI